MIKFLGKYGIYVIVLAAFLLRLVRIEQSLWLDEAISALAARDYSFYGIIFDFLKGDNHPPLFYLILRGWGLLFGFSDIPLRMLSVLLGTATIWLTYLFLKKLINSKVALLGSLFLATSPLHIYYSQEIRMYPILAFFVICLMYLFLFTLEDKVKMRYWVGVSILTVLTVATDYVGLFILPVLVVIGLWKKQKLLWWQKLTMILIPLVLISLLWIPLFLMQTETARAQLSGLPGWKSIAGGANLKEVVVLWMKFVLGRISFEPKVVYYLLTSFFSLGFFVGLLQAIKSKQNKILWIILLVPLVSSFLVSFVVPAFNYFRFIYVLPVFYGITAAGLLSIKRKAFYFPVIALILLGNIIGNCFYFFDQHNQREMWKQAVLYTEQNPADVTVFEFPSPFDPYEWYAQDYTKGFGALNGLPVDQKLSEAKIEAKISGSTSSLYHISYLRDLTDSDRFVEQKIEQLGFKKIQSKSFAGVGEVSRYERY